MVLVDLRSSMYDRILLPTDGSEPTDRAFDYATDLATTYGASLHVLYVIDATILASEAETDEVADRFRDAGTAVVDRVCERASQRGVETVDGQVVQGTPYRRILEHADSLDADVIVMGTHGRTGLDRYLLGSVTEKVVRLSDAPVLTVRRDRE